MHLTQLQINLMTTLTMGCLIDYQLHPEGHEEALEKMIERGLVEREFGLGRLINGAEYELEVFNLTIEGARFAARRGYDGDEGVRPDDLPTF